MSGIETRPGSNPPWSTLLPRKLVQNLKIKNQFINLIADLLNTNFESTRVIGIINQMAGHIANGIGRHRQRWGISEQTANSHLKRMISFAQERPAYLRGFVRDYFRCGNNGTISINSTSGGKIKLNSLYFIPGDMPWSGIYFQNNPVHLEAIPDPGYKFDGWTGAIQSPDLSVTLSITNGTNVAASFSALSSIADEMGRHGHIPERMELFQNYPNPFNDATSIEFALPRPGLVTLNIYNLLGRNVAALVSERLAAGIHTFKWDGGGLAGGLYLYRLEMENFVQSKKLLLMR